MILILLLVINIIGFAAASFYFSNFPIHGSIVDFGNKNETQSGAQISQIGRFVQFALEIIRETGK
jgi:hypothetical protein